VGLKTIIWNLTIGTFDNVSVRRDLSFMDKLRGIRREFLRYFGGYDQYEALLRDRPTGWLEKRDGFLPLVSRVMNIKDPGTAGKMIRLVNHSDEVWNLMQTILTGLTFYFPKMLILLVIGTYRTEQKQRKQKKDASSKDESLQIPVDIQRGVHGEMQSDKKVKEFSGLPDDILQPLLSSVVKGDITLEAATSQAMVIKQEGRMIDAANKYLESHYPDDETKRWEVAAKDKSIEHLVSQFSGKINIVIFSQVFVVGSFMYLFKDPKKTSALFTPLLKNRFEEKLDDLFKVRVSSKPIVLKMEDDRMAFIKKFDPKFLKGSSIT
jgi:hypothetical protein